MLRSAAAAMIAAALLVLAARIGWERAIPVALAVLAGGGILCVLAAVFAPKAHVLSGAVLLIVGVLASVAVFLTA